MKRARRIMGAAVLAATLIPLMAHVGQADAAVATPTIANPGFEVDGKPVNGAITGWTSTGTANAAYTQASGRSGKFNLAHWKAGAYQAFTSQRLTGLANGYYTLGAYVQNGGGQRSVYLSATTTGKPEARTALPVTATWTHVSIRGIHVTDGALTIGLRSDANAGNWAKVDDVELTAGAPYDFLAGGDVTMANWVTNSGGVYTDPSGARKDPLQILAENGNDIVRLRFFNGTGPDHPSLADPSLYLPKGYQDENDMVDLARRAAAQKMKIELTFHYSDWWTNGSTSDIPKDWRYVTSLPTAQAVTELEKLVYDYTKRVMQRLAAQGSTPQFVSLGNEMQGGILYPYGAANSAGKPNLARFLKAGYRAVKEVSPSSQVIIHLDDAGNYSKYRSFFGMLNSNGVPYDVIGASYYPYWTKLDVPTIKQFFTTISQEFGKKIMVMETGINWNPVTHTGVEGQLHDNGTVPYGETPAGQRDFLYELFAALKDVPDGAVIGDLYWDPVMIPANGVGWAVGGDNVVSNTTLFDFAGKALPALDAYRFNTDPQ